MFFNIGGNPRVIIQNFYRIASTYTSKRAPPGAHKKASQIDSLFLYATYLFPIQEAVKLAATAAMPASKTARPID